MFFPETGNAAAEGGRDLRDRRTRSATTPISTQTFDANVPTHVDNDVLVTTAPGVSTAQARHAIDNVLKDYPTAELMTKTEFKGSVANQIDKILNLSTCCWRWRW